MAAITTQTIEVDLTPGGISPFLYVSQGDYGSRSLVFNLYSNGQEYAIPSTVTSIIIEGSTKSGNSFAVSCSYSTNDNSCVGSLTNDMTQEVGIDICQLVLRTSQSRLGSCNFYIDVEQNAITPGVVYQSSYFADLAKSWAIGDTGLRTNENVNNSKYWAQISQESVANLELRITNDESAISRNTDSIISQNAFLNSITELKPIYIVNETSDYLIDNSENKLKGLKRYLITDSTGEEDGCPINSSAVGKTFLMQYKDMGLPVMYLDHKDIESLKTKSDGTLSNVAIHFPYKNIDTTLKKLKVQGASSQNYPEKNYTITFNSDVILNNSWGKHKKYVIKADWVDFSHMRNEISAKLWGQIRKTSIKETNPLIDNNGNYLADNSSNHLLGESRHAFSMGLNYGAIDGYPICVVINGKYWGIYSLTIPKDDWMAGMTGEYTYEAIVSAENNSQPTRFKGLITYQDEDGEMYGEDADGSIRVAYSLEYVPDEDNISWISTSLNNLISSVMATYSTAEECLTAISAYLDIDNVIDYYIFNCVVNNLDGMSKNFVFDTWDGVKWYFAAYDMDGTFGNEPGGKFYDSASGGCTFLYFKNANRLMNLIYTFDKAALKTRYQNLRTNVLSESNFANLVWNYAVNIPKAAFDYEGLRWPSRPGTNTNNVHQILDFFRIRCQVLDAEIAAL